MYRTIRTVVVVSALILTSTAFTELIAQETHYLGGAVKGIQVKTDPSVVSTNNNPTPAGSGPFGLLPSSELTVHMNPGESDLFVYEFDALCQTGGENDFIEVQARVNGLVRGVLGGPAILQPQPVPTFLWLCQGQALTVVAKSWVARLSAGSEGVDYTFTIWWRAVDVAPANPGLRGIFNNRIVKLTRYN